MIKKMLVNATHPEENRVAIVEDGILSELDIEVEGKEQTKGNIYKATVIRVEQGLQAAFVDYGAERLGFLQMGEIQSSLFPKSDNGSKGRPRINDVLRRGQEILVQVTKEERGNKGAALTTFLSLAGRYMVLMPGDNTRGMSRKIPDGAERKQLKESIRNFELPEEMGYIIRTAAIGQTAEELTRDLNYLLRVYDNIMELSRKVKAPALIYRESNLMIRSIRDYFTQDMDEVLVDDPEVFKEAQAFFQQVMPEYAKLVKLHQERRPIFAKYQIEDQIETISQKQVFLPGGGSIVIDTTEALVAIDVNSGKMASEQGVEGTAYKTNLEAADEAARQLRLRDLGGLVVIDFIDMRDRKHIREVEKRLKDALKSDKARVTVGRISQFGLLEMSRQRIKAALAEGSYLSCPNCHGTGRVRSIEAQAVAFLRKVHAAAARGQIDKIEGEVPLAVSHYLLNNKREELIDLERRYQVDISIRGRKSFVADQSELTLTKRDRDEKKSAEDNEPVTAATTLAEHQEESKAGPRSDAGEDKPAKKPRRRRGRKGARSDQPTEAAGPDTTEAAAGQEQEPPDGSGDDAAAENGQEPKRASRRRRGRRGRKSTDTTARNGEGTTGPDEEQAQNEPRTPAPAEAQAGAAGPSGDAAPPAEKADDAPAKPARKRRTRKPKESKAAAAPTETPPAEDRNTAPGDPAPAPPGEEVPGDQAGAEAPPAKRPTRRPPKTRSRGEAASTAADRGEAPKETPTTDQPGKASEATEAAASQTTPAVKGRSRRAPRTGTAAGKAAEAGGTSGSGPEEVAGEAEKTTEDKNKKTEEKPKRTRRTRSAKAEKTASTKAATKSSGATDEEGTAAKPRPRKTTTRKKPAQDNSPETQDQTGDNQEATRKRTPRRRPATKKTPDDQGQSE